MNEKLKDKIKEALSSVLPIAIIISLMCLLVTPVSTELMIMFFVGSTYLIFGMGFFSLGAEMSMSLIGERIGANLSKSKRIWFIALIAFIVGTITTISEPDLSVLATQISEIPNFTLIISVGIGVGLFLAIALCRIAFKIRLSRIIIFSYIIIFILSFFVPEEFLPLSFDSGGVTTGPMTVPFIIALGLGAASIRSDKNSESDSFGLVSLCSIGPILAVMILGLVYKINGGDYTPLIIDPIYNSKDIGNVFLTALPQTALEVLRSLTPIVVFYFLYNLFALKIPKNENKRIIVGFVYTFIGLTIFLTGVEKGFLPVGNGMGMALVNFNNMFLAIPIIALIGFFIVQAEPAVQVLVNQVNTITDGTVPSNLLRTTLSIGMSLALVISFIRAWLGIPFMYFIIPGYLLAIILTFFAPEIFIGIAFDSGGVTSGPLTASFILPLMIGVCEASMRTNLNVMQDAFGLVAMVAMMPLITIQIIGIIYKKKTKSSTKQIVEEIANDEIIIFKRKVINTQSAIAES